MGKSDRRCPSDIFEALCPRCVHREGCVVRTAGPDLFSELGPTALTTTVALLQTKRPGDLLPDAGGLVEVDFVGLFLGQVVNARHGPGRDGIGDLPCNVPSGKKRRRGHAHRHDSTQNERPDSPSQ